MPEDNTFASERRWTDRKRDVLELLARGRTNAEIADSLGLTLAGAKWHVSEVLSILGVESREEAAEYWRRERSLRRRIGRVVRAFGAPALSWKTLAGSTGLAAVAGGVVFIGGLSSDDGNFALADSFVASETPGAVATVEPPDPMTLDYVDILTTDLGGGDSATLSASTGSYLCFRTTRASLPQSFGFGCYGERSRFKTALMMGFGGTAKRDDEGRWAILRGSASAVADHIEIDLYEGGTLSVPLVSAPPQLSFDAKFWAVVLPNIELVARYRSVDAAGNTLAEEALYDPPGTPQRPQVVAPLSELVLVGSHRDDPSSGTIPFGGSRRGAIATPAGGVYRFGVEHDGTKPLTLHFWCQTGVIQLAWESGPDSAGNGTIAADIPPNSAGCFFIVLGGDGTHRISTISSP